MKLGGSTIFTLVDKDIALSVETPGNGLTKGILRHAFTFNDEYECYSIYIINLA